MIIRSVHRHHRPTDYHFYWGEPRECLLCQFSAKSCTHVVQTGPRSAISHFRRTLAARFRKKDRPFQEIHGLGRHFICHICRNERENSMEIAKFSAAGLLGRLLSCPILINFDLFGRSWWFTRVCNILAIFVTLSPESILGDGSSGRHEPAARIHEPKTDDNRDARGRYSRLQCPSS